MTPLERSPIYLLERRGITPPGRSPNVYVSCQGYTSSWDSSTNTFKRRCSALTRAAARRRLPAFERGIAEAPPRSPSPPGFFDSSLSDIAGDNTDPKNTTTPSFPPEVDGTFTVHGSPHRPALRGGASRAFQEQVRGGTCGATLLLCIPVVGAVEGLAQGCSRAARGARAWETTCVNVCSRYCIIPCTCTTTATTKKH